jgi:hypothetical protein
MFLFFGTRADMSLFVGSVTLNMCTKANKFVLSIFASDRLVRLRQVSDLVRRDIRLGDQES